MNVCCLSFRKRPAGIAIVFGPVMDPQGVYGIGMFQVQDEAEMRGLLEHDPANRLLRYEVLPMAAAVVGTCRLKLSWVSFVWFSLLG